MKNYLAINDQQAIQLAEDLTTEEIATVTNAIAGIKIKDMHPDELHNVTLKMMGEIKILTGAILHTGEKLQLQIDVIKRFLFLHFSMLNQKEIVHAFYLNVCGTFSQVYRHYNRELNCEFIGDVLRDYLSYKVQLRETKGHLIDKAINPNTKLIAAPAIDLPTWQEIIQKEYDLMRADKEDHYSVWALSKYETLKICGLIPAEDESTLLYFTKRLLPEVPELTILPGNADLKHYAFETLESVYAILKGQVAITYVQSEAKRRCYYYILNSLIVCGINKIFEDVKPL